MIDLAKLFAESRSRNSLSKKVGNNTFVENHNTNESTDLCTETAIRLHNTRIVIQNNKTKCISFFAKGFHTNVTRDRMNEYGANGKLCINKGLLCWWTNDSAHFAKTGKYKNIYIPFHDGDMYDPSSNCYHLAAEKFVARTL